MQSEYSDPEEADARQQILGLMEDRSVARLHEATLDYCERFPKSSWGWLISVPNLIDMGCYKQAKKALRKARVLSAKQAAAGSNGAGSVADSPAANSASTDIASSASTKTDTTAVTDALARADAVAQIDPETDARLCYWSCMIYKDQGDLKRAQRWIEEAIEQHEAEGSYWVTYGEILAKRGKVKQARNAHLAAIEAATSDVDEAHFNLALLLRGRRRYSDALVEVEKALKIDPDYAEAHALRQDLQTVIHGTG